MQTELFPRALTVSQLTLRIRKLLEDNPEMQDARVSGEISNLSRPASGHIYFTLKDKGASLRCVMWRSDAQRTRPVLQEGAAVEARGKIVVYEPQGQYQLVANWIRPQGEGALFQEFLRLKSALEAEGLFDAESKREIPEFPKVIGVVTSATGAALRDMLNTIRRRQPLTRVILAASPVQGADAPPALVNALEALNRQKPDLILIARGGGSLEDLWAFNDERVVRAVAASSAPTISGVGHETDFTLTDFVADLRAATPTAAAELATAVSRDDLQAELTHQSSRLVDLTASRISDSRNLLAALTARLRYYSPARRVQLENQRLDEMTRRVASALTHRIQLQAFRVDGLSKRLGALNPENVLARGYAVVTRVADGKLVRNAEQAQGALRVRVRDGEFEVERVS
ncbi:MAG: exodeoxyribonuclease VII large subunit [Anaerolineales bacterium]|nr:exodeoxyribonuclease VII large subunit [Anaerolineales bacterium]